MRQCRCVYQCKCVYQCRCVNLHVEGHVMSAEGDGGGDGGKRSV